MSRSRPVAQLSAAAAAAMVVIALSGCAGTVTAHPGGTTSAGSASSQAPATPASPGPAAAPGFDMAHLASLHNYSFTYTAPSLKVVGSVHGPTSWKTVTVMTVKSSSVTSTDYDVDGQGYGTIAGMPGVQRTTLSTPQGLEELSGQEHFAKPFLQDVADTATSMRMRTTGPCHEAGVAGTAYEFVTRKATSTLFAVAARGCVADDTGALLSFQQDVTGGAYAGMAGTAKSQTFAVTSIGDVAAITAPPGA